MLQDPIITTLFFVVCFSVFGGVLYLLYRTKKEHQLMEASFDSELSEVLTGNGCCGAHEDCHGNCSCHNETADIDLPDFLASTGSSSHPSGEDTTGEPQVAAIAIATAAMATSSAIIDSTISDSSSSSNFDSCSSCSDSGGSSSSD